MQQNNQVGPYIYLQTQQSVKRKTLLSGKKESKKELNFEINMYHQVPLGFQATYFKNIQVSQYTIQQSTMITLSQHMQKHGKAQF